MAKLSGMGTAVLACRILLAAVFATAAAGKLMDLAGSRRSLQAFGIQGDAARILGTALPFAELAAALLLVIQPTAQIGASLALVLLSVFIVGIVNALRQGKTPDCNCFGALHSAPAGRNTIGRNVALAAVAIFALVEGPGPTIDSWVAGRSGAVVVAVCLSLLAVVLSVLAFWTWSKNRDLTQQVEEAHRIVHGIPPGLPIGTLAPEFDVRAVDGGRLTLASLRALGRPVVLLFAFPGCGVCTDFMPDLLHWAPALADRLTFGVLGWATTERVNEARATMLLDGTFPADLDEEMQALLRVLESYKLVGTPSAVVVSPDGLIASSTVDGRPAIEALIRVALSRSAAVPSRGTGSFVAG